MGTSIKYDKSRHYISLLLYCRFAYHTYITHTQKRLSEDCEVSIWLTDNWQFEFEIWREKKWPTHKYIHKPAQTGVLLNRCLIYCSVCWIYHKPVSHRFIEVYDDVIFTTTGYSQSQTNYCRSLSQLTQCVNTKWSTLSLCISFSVRLLL